MRNQKTLKSVHLRSLHQTPTPSVFIPISFPGLCMLSCVHHSLHSQEAYSHSLIFSRSSLSLSLSHSSLDGITSLTWNSEQRTPDLYIVTVMSSTQAIVLLLIAVSCSQVCQYYHNFRPRSEATILCHDLRPQFKYIFITNLILTTINHRHEMFRLM